MKSLKQFKIENDETITISLNEMNDEIMLEAKNEFKKDAPFMLTFRRVSYQYFPNRKVIALYYSRDIDKYLSVPFGPEGSLSLDEATIIEDWQKVNRKDKTDGLSQKAVNAYRRENPGSKLQTAVTEKNPKGKRAARRKSFCSRMGGMKKRLTSAKTARDPDSRINKALRRWNCEEEFKMKLNEMRLQREGIADVLDTGAEAIIPYYGAGKKLYKGDYSGAAKDAVIDTALLATGAAAGKALGAGARLAGKGISKLTSKFTKPATKAADVASDVSKVKPSPDISGLTPTEKLGKMGELSKQTPAGQASKEGIFSKLTGRLKDTAEKGIGAADLAGGAASTIADFLKGKDTSSIKSTKVDIPKLSARVKSSTDISKPMSSAVSQSKLSSYEQQLAKQARQASSSSQRMKQMQENKMGDLRRMIFENIEFKDININGRTITLNKSMAKRILEVYDSVSDKNKKLVENMINTDLESFKKLLNFSIRN